MGGKSSKGKEVAQKKEMHEKMEKFTNEKDQHTDRDVEGQLLAKTLARVRESFGASSLEYDGIRKMLVLGIQVEELEARAQTLEEGRTKYSVDTPEYTAYREKCLYIPENLKNGKDYTYDGSDNWGDGSTCTTTGKKQQKKKKKKKKKKKHRH